MRRQYLSFVFASILAAGCQAASPAPEASELAPAQGLTLLEKVPGLRTRAAYRVGERTVFLETRAAEPVAEELRKADPSLPEHGTDVRITAEDGSLVYARIAGEGVDFAENEVAPASPEEAMLNLAAARAGISAMALEAHRSLVADEATQAQVLDDVGAALDEIAVPEEDSSDTGAGEATDTAEGTDTGSGSGEGTDTAEGTDTGTGADTGTGEGTEAEDSGSASTSSTRYRHKIELWKGKYCPSGVCVPGAYHSATRTRGCTSYHGSLYCTIGPVDRCNDGGRCPGDSGMSMDCTYTSGWRTNLPISPQTCSTPYFWGSTTGHHNCNDSSHLQVINIRHNRTYARNLGSCNDPQSNFAPDGCGDIFTW